MNEVLYRDGYYLFRVLGSTHVCPKEYAQRLRPSWGWDCGLVRGLGIRQVRE